MAVSVPVPGQRGDNTIAQINITPLVDVLLVLLVIFMVTAPVLSDTLDLRLPQAAPPVGAKPMPRLTLQVHSSGEFELSGARLTSTQLGAALRLVARDAPDTLLEIAASPDADYQGFARALGEARASGLENVAFPR